MPTFTAGTPYTGTITVNNATSATVTGLPTGVTVTSTTPSGTDLIINLGGTPTIAGEAFNIQVAATNACGGGLTTSSNTGNAGTGTVGGGAGTCTSPSVGTVSLTSNAEGAAYSATIVVSNATSVTAVSGLPTGVTYTTSGSNPVTINLSGTTSAAGSYPITVSAENACGGGLTTSTVSGASAGTVTVAAAGTCPAPSVGTVSVTSNSEGAAYSATIVVSNATSVSAVNGLPPGVTFTTSGSNPVTINLSGTTTTAGSYPITVSAENACGGGLATSTVSGASAGTVTVAAAGTCPVPSVSTITPATGTTGSAYTGTLTITNATTATITNLPAGLTQSGAASGANYVITVTGTVAADSSTTLLVDATNACGGGLATSSVTGQSGGPLVFTATPACATPSVGQLSPLTATANTPYNGTLTITNATGGTITNLPAGLNQSGAASGANWVITVTGTPVANSSTALLVNADNTCGTGTAAFVTGANGGTLVVSGASTECPTPSVGTLTTLTGTVGSAYSGTLTVLNATTATITNLPAGLSQSGAPSGGAYIITVTGTPTAQGTTALLVDATNACGGGLNTTSVTGQSGGSLVIDAAAPGACPTPSTGTISFNSGTVGTAFGATVTVTDATTATITNLPAGLTQSGAVSGSNYVITISGTPTSAGTTALLVDATNACATGTPTSATGQGAGNLVIAPASAGIPWDGLDCCGTPVTETLPYTPGDTTTIGTAFGMARVSNNPNAAKQIRTAFGVSAISDTCNNNTIAITNAAMTEIYEYEYDPLVSTECP
jgi:hypothetical protein